ncbi:hypothetical protein RHSP_54461 [Rhizobium freirei PRF 81]|uniref:SPW repeat-containing integral membrane domain-containing protein n=1 Tax=Rhizobium freirei PRF 81 TaxID=363754 RepID=N6V2D3_9HYPH|nr:SPW repeat protein [Rhizobium freirei]ENN85267.1 hypothetical protein RHSP_54461 [Rhizobium freirei PRF 81]
MKERRWQDHIIFVVGLWLIVSPWSLGALGSDSLPLGGAAWSFFLCGLAVAALGGLAYASRYVWEDRLDILFGVWLVASPWILRFADHTLLTWNAILSGLLLTVLAGWVLWGKHLTDL